MSRIKSELDKLRNNPGWYDNRNWFAFIFSRMGYNFPGMSISIATMTVITAFMALLQVEYKLITIDFPHFFHTVLGLVIGLLLVFRTNTAYDRWWEGRKQLGALVNTTRNLGIKFEAYLEGHTYEGKDEIRLLIPGFAWAMKEHLREQDYNKADALIPNRMLPAFNNSDHKPNQVLLELSRHICKMLNQGVINGHQLQVLEFEMSGLTNILGACERIRNTPIPMGYALHLKRILLIYVLTLPVTLIKEMEWWAVPFSVILFYTMVGIELIGEEIEDPFGTDPNDLPFDALEGKIRNNINDLMSQG